MAMFDYAVANSRNPLCYNGDILSLSQAEALQRRYPAVEAVMIGRGLIADPGLLRGRTDRESLEGFLTELLEVYEVEFGGSRNAMFRMKENWGFLHSRFEGSDKLWKALRKTTDVSEFKSLSAQILHTCPFRPNP
jgi:tRNA-dihydrouridine synthase